LLVGWQAELPGPSSEGRLRTRCEVAVIKTATAVINTNKALPNTNMALPNTNMATTTVSA